MGAQLQEPELVLPREAAGRLLELDARERPAFLRVSFSEGTGKRRTFVWEVRETPNPGEGWVYVPSIGPMIAAFSSVKVYSARGIRILYRDRLAPTASHQAQFRRLLDTYGWRDPMPRLSATVLGLGRLGSKVACNLSEQGIQKLVLVDSQEVERPNQQLAVYRRVPLGTPKVLALASFLKGTRIVPIQRAVEDLTEEDWAEVFASDVIFVCVDSALARVLACLRAMSAGIPLFEGGVHIQYRDGQVVGLLGRVQTAIPGLWCLFDLPEGLDLQGSLQELGQRIAAGDIFPEPRPADPTLSEWVATTMVLAFRQALLGQGIRPRYLLQAGSNGQETSFQVRESLVVIPERCPHCRPRTGQHKIFVNPSLFAEPDIGGGTGPKRTPRWDHVERVAVKAGTAVTGVAMGLASLGLAFGLLLAIREMVGFRGPYGALPNLGEFLWHFDHWRFQHTAWNCFGTIPSAALLVMLPYLLLGFPLFCARLVHRRLSGWLVRRKILRGLRSTLSELWAVFQRMPDPPPFRVPLPLVRGLQRLGQGLAIVTEAGALLLLFPLFKSWGGQAWLVLTFSMFLPGLMALAIGRGVVANHRRIANVIQELSTGEIPRRGGN